MEQSLFFALGGLILGVAVGFWWGSRRAKSLRDALDQERGRRIELEARLNAFGSLEDRLKDVFASLTLQALRQSSEQLVSLADSLLGKSIEKAKAEFVEKERAVESMVAPVKELLEKMERRMEQMEREREGAHRELLTQVRDLAEKSELLRRETERLYTALRRPSVRGRWGEITLRNAIELAGLSRYADFVEQESLKGQSSVLRPDVVIRLPGGRFIAVDAKVPIDRYLDAMEAESEEERVRLLKEHAKAVRDHIKRLSDKSYWKALGDALDFVVMFIPADSFLSAALEVDRDLLEDGVRRRVIVATPTLLVALLRVVALTWREFELARQVKQIVDMGRELVKRSSTLTDRMDKLGRQISSVVKSYNEAVASWNNRFLPHLVRVAGVDDSLLRQLDMLEMDVRSVRKVDYGEAGEKSGGLSGGNLPSGSEEEGG